MRHINWKSQRPHYRTTPICRRLGKRIKLRRPNAFLALGQLETRQSALRFPPFPETRITENPAPAMARMGNVRNRRFLIPAAFESKLS